MLEIEYFISILIFQTRCLFVDQKLNNYATTQKTKDLQDLMNNKYK